MDKSSQKKSAKELGFTARGIGLPLSANIYGKSGPLSKAWEDGWKSRDRKKRGLPK